MERNLKKFEAPCQLFGIIGVTLVMLLHETEKLLLEF